MDLWDHGIQNMLHKALGYVLSMCCRVAERARNGGRGGTWGGGLTKIHESNALHDVLIILTYAS